MQLDTLLYETENLGMLLFQDQGQELKAATSHSSLVRKKPPGSLLSLSCYNHNSELLCLSSSLWGSHL